MRIEYTLARNGAEKLWKLVNETPFVNCLGALTGGQAVQQVKAGIKAIYLSGWQVAADNNSYFTMFPDQSLYPADSVPKVVERINNAFTRADEIQHAKGIEQGDKDFIDYAITINPRIIVNSPFVEDLELVIDLINQDSGLFKMLPEHISEKREIVLAALECVEEWSDFLEGLSTTYLGDKNFVTEYLSEAYDIFNYITNDLRGDKDLVIQILNSNPNNHCLSDIKESLHNDFDVINALVSSNSEEFENIPNEFKNNTSIVVQLVKENIEVLHYMDEEMKLSEEFVSQIRNFPEFEQNKDYFPEVVMAINAYDREKELASILEEKTINNDDIGMNYYI
mgnify:CR=1 FL=1